MPLVAPGQVTAGRQVASGTDPRALASLAVAFAVALSVCVSFSGSPAQAQERALPDRFWGVTLDNTAGLASGKLSQEVASLEALPAMPFTRIVMDVGTKPAAYTNAVNTLHPASYLMAELGDSSEMKHQSVLAYRHFEQSLVSAFSATVDLWEVGNEVNGEWVGPTSKEVAKMTAAYDSVKAIGGQTELTLYYNPDCWSRRSHEMFTWAQANIPASMKLGLDDVLFSYYPDDCNDYWPSDETWQSVFDQLHAMFPHAHLGFGESGISTDNGSPTTKASLLSRYYSLQVADDNYVGGYFWWYYAEDAVPYQDNVVWNALNGSITAGSGPTLDEVDVRP